MNKNEKDTQLKAQGNERGFVDPVTSAGFLSWSGTFLLRSIITFFTMEFVRSWFKKFRKEYLPEEESEDGQKQPAEELPRNTEE
jgi:hypothetical protein